MLLSEPARLCAAIGTAQLWKLLNRMRVQPQARQSHAGLRSRGAIAHRSAQIRVLGSGPLLFY